MTLRPEVSCAQAAAMTDTLRESIEYICDNDPWLDPTQVALLRRMVDAIEFAKIEDMVIERGDV